MFTLVSIAPVSTAHTLNNTALEQLLSFHSRLLLRNVFIATLWDRNKLICKRPIPFKFLSHLKFFSYFSSVFLFWEGDSVLILLQEHLIPGRGKRSFLLHVLSFSVKQSNDTQRAKISFPWKAPKLHQQCQKLNYNPG